MERSKMKIKFKSLATKNPTDHPPADSIIPLLKVAGTSETNSSCEEAFLAEKSRTMKRKLGSREHDEQTVSAIGQCHNLVYLDEEHSSLYDTDDADLNSAIDSDALSQVPELPSKVSTVNAEVLNNRPLGRVKVRLRTSKGDYAHLTQTQSDTERSNPLTASDKHGEYAEKFEDSANSLPSKHGSVSEIFSRKTSSIKIKPSKELTVSSSVDMGKHVSNPNSPVQILGIGLPTSKALHKKESCPPNQDLEHNENELSTALEVIRKIMKMDAAEPFNAPVNPVALGIPDYFDIIETPMDFGTICSDLEHGRKYANSEEVYRDIQYIWENCYRYNNKGDYILNLMKRVKKNFMKYWMGAGLYFEPSTRNSVADGSLDQDSGTLDGFPQEDENAENKPCEEPSGSINGFESNEEDDIPQSNREKVKKDSHNKKNKARRRHGIDLHKSNCLCAVCVVRRRKREREGSLKLAKKKGKKSSINQIQKLKQEGKPTSSNFYGEDESSNLYISPESNADDEMEDQGDGMKFENPGEQNSPHLEQEKKRNSNDFQNRGDNKPYRKALPDYENTHDLSEQSRGQDVDSPGFAVQTHDQNDDWPVQQNEVTIDPNAEMPLKLEESSGKHQVSKSQDKLFAHENPVLLQLCGTLFSDDPRSVWSGPHSLIRRARPRGNGSIHAAVSMLMK